MNRILKSFFAIFVMVLCLGFQSQVCNAQSGDADEDVVELVRELASTINEACPEDMGNGISLQSCTASKTTLIMVVGLPNGIKPSIFTSSEEFKKSFISGLNSSEMPFGTLCGMLGITLKVTLKSNLGQSSVVYTPEQLVSD